MTFSLIQSPAALSQTGVYAASITRTFASPPVVGNLIVVTGGGYGNDIQWTIEDNYGHRYDIRQTPSGNNFNSFVAWVVVKTTGASFTVTASDGGQNIQDLKINEFAGAMPSGGVDFYVMSALSNNSTTTTTGTSTVAGDLIISTFVSNAAVSLTTPPTDYISLLSSATASSSHASAYKIASGAGSEVTTWPDFNVTAYTRALTIAFKALPVNPKPVTKKTKVVNQTIGSGSANTAITIPAITPGNSVVLYVSEAGSDTITGTIDNQSNSYLQTNTSPVFGNGRRVFHCITSVKKPTQVTVQAPTNVAIQYAILEVSGLNPTAILDVSAYVAQGAGSTSHSVPYTPTSDNEFTLLGITWGASGNSAMTNAPGFTSLPHSLYGFDVQYSVDSGIAGAKTIDFTSETSRDAYFTVVSFRTISSTRIRTFGSRLGTEFVGIEKSYISVTNPTTNYSTSNTLRIGNVNGLNHYGYVKFTGLSNITGQVKVKSVKIECSTETNPGA